LNRKGEKHFVINTSIVPVMK